MFGYIIRRIVAMIPTLIGITILSFIIINLAPGGPIEQKIRQIQFGSGNESAGSSHGTDQGVSEEVIEALKKQYGFDKPLFTRYLIWLKNVLTLDFGESFTYEEPVWQVIVGKFPVSLQFGITSFILIYLISVPLGIMKAVRHGQQFDASSSMALLLMYSIPPLMLAILLRTFLASESYLAWFPLQGLYSDGYESLSTWGKIVDRIRHFVLPITCYVMGSFTVLTFLMKNSFLDVVKLDYIRTARAKGLPERQVLYKHALRNALIPIATGFGSFLGIFFAGSLIIEQVYNLDGIGLLGYKAALDRDYNLIMGLIYIQTILMLVGRLLSDFMYTIIDPRIDFS